MICGSRDPPEPWNASVGPRLPRHSGDQRQPTDAAWQENRAGEEQVWVLKAGRRNPARPYPWHVRGTLLTSLQSLTLIPAQLQGPEKSSSEGQSDLPKVIQPARGRAGVRSQTHPIAKLLRNPLHCDPAPQQQVRLTWESQNTSSWVLVHPSENCVRVSV